MAQSVLCIFWCFNILTVMFHWVCQTGHNKTTVAISETCFLSATNVKMVHQWSFHHRLSSLRLLPPIDVLLVSLLSHYSESASWHSLLWPLTVTQPMWQGCARGFLRCFPHTEGRRVYKLCVVILQPELPNGKISGVLDHAFVWSHLRRMLRMVRAKAGRWTD